MQEIQEANKWKANPPSLSHTVPHLKRADSFFGFSPIKKYTEFNIIPQPYKSRVKLILSFIKWETVTTRLYKIINVLVTIIPLYTPVSHFVITSSAQYIDLKK